MNTKALAFMMISLLSTSLVFGMGEKKEKQNTTEVAGSQSTISKERTAHARALVKKINETNKWQERKPMIIDFLTLPPVQVQGGSGAQITYDYANELFGKEHTKEDVRTIMDQIPKEIDPYKKLVLMNAIFKSPYKDVKSEGYKKTAEKEKDLFIKGEATSFLIMTGNESEGFEYMNKYFDYMNRNKKLVQTFSGVGYFRSEKMREEVKNYLEKIKGDINKSEEIRCFAAIYSAAYFKTEIDMYYEMMSDILLRNDVDADTALCLLKAINYYRKKNDAKAIEIFERIVKKGSLDVKKIAEGMLGK